jgi:hypothetical protein
MPSDPNGHRDLLPEEASAGSDDPQAETAVILEESAEREEARTGEGDGDGEGELVEHRTSDVTVEP